nr:hypothetical protein [Streptomyces sp. S1D4-11]QIZ01033.1 hypothetical protein HEP87_54430 [Streptomyces sp. S1D4-11]
MTAWWVACIRWPGRCLLRFGPRPEQRGADHPLSRVGGHRLDADDLPDEPALAREQWTGIEVRHDEPAAYLDLWLATMNSGLSFGRLSIGSSARTLGPADPAIR